MKGKEKDDTPDGTGGMPQAAAAKGVSMTTAILYLAVFLLGVAALFHHFAITESATRTNVALIENAELRAAITQIACGNENSMAKNTQVLVYNPYVKKCISTTEDATIRSQIYIKALAMYNQQVTKAGV